jgi:hypothetical protein
MSDVDRYRVAIALHYNRKYGLFKPLGKFYYGRWEPTKTERNDCCKDAAIFFDGERVDDLFYHCCSLLHCCNLLGVNYNSALKYLMYEVSHHGWKPYQEIQSYDDIMNHMLMEKLREVEEG